MYQQLSRNAWAAYGMGVPIGTPLLDPSVGQFTRSATATVSALTSASTLAYWPVDTLRYENRGDGFGSLPLFEGNRIQWIHSSENFSIGSWITTFATYTSNNVISPDGNMTAGTVAFNATTSASLRSAYADPRPPPNVTVAISFWFHEGTGTKTAYAYLIDKNGLFQGALQCVGTSVWQQGSIVVGTGTVANSCIVEWHNSPGGTAHQFVPWGVQMETGTFPTSYIQNFSTSGEVQRCEDVLQYMPSQVPFHVRARKWSQSVYPYWANTDAVNGDEYWLYSFSAGDGLRFRKTAGNVKLEALRGGSIVADSGVIVNARQAKLDLVIDPVAGILSVGGVAGPTGSKWEWPSGTPLRQGGVMSLANEFYGRMGAQVAL